MSDPILAIDIGGTKISAAMVEHGSVSQRRQVATPRTGRGSDLLDAMATATKGLSGRLIAVATTGIVQQGRVTALNPSTLPIEDSFPLADAVLGRLGSRPLTVNDAQAAAWGEYRFGAGVGTDALLFVTISTGIGGAVVINGRLATGRRGLAGHIGHVVVDAEGPQCGCGRRGCIERLASGRAIAEQARHLGPGATAETVFAAAAAGDRASQHILHRAAELIVGVLTDAVALLDLDRIVIGGGVGLAPGFANRVADRLAAAPAPFARPVVTATLGADAGLVGAAQLLEEGWAPPESDGAPRNDETSDG